MTEEERDLAIRRLEAFEQELHDRYMAPLEVMPHGAERRAAEDLAREIIRREYLAVASRRRRHGLLRGVRRRARGFIATACADGVNYHLGSFDTERAAHKAYLQFRAKHPVKFRVHGGRMMPELLGVKS